MKWSVESIKRRWLRRTVLLIVVIPIAIVFMAGSIIEAIVDFLNDLRDQFIYLWKLK